MPWIQQPALRSYRRVRGLYTFTSGLLAAWEMMGVELSHAPAPGAGIRLKSPEAVPSVLLVFLVYLAFRMTLEWLECEPEYRRRWPPRADFIAAHALAGGAALLCTAQRALRLQIASHFGGAIVYLGILILLAIALAASWGAFETLVSAPWMAVGLAPVYVISAGLAPRRVIWSLLTLILLTAALVLYATGRISWPLLVLAQAASSGLFLLIAGRELRSRALRNSEEGP